MNFGWGDGFSLGGYAEYGPRVGGTGLGSGATVSQSLDYNFKHNTWSTTTTEGAYASFGPFNAGGSLSMSINLTNGQWSPGWSTYAGIGTGNGQSGIGLYGGYGGDFYGSGSWTYGMGGSYYTDYEMAYMRAEIRNYNNVEAVFASYELGGVTFDQLWGNYPSSHVLHLDKNGNDIYEGVHCAIDLSEALNKSGIYLSGGKRCPGGDHFLVAQHLANSLNNGGYGVTTMTGSNFYGQIRGKQGIVFFQDYWHRSIDPVGVRTGDHIDLWNGSYLKSSGWWGTRLRLNFPNTMERYGVSSLYRSNAVWFWEF